MATIIYYKLTEDLLKIARESMAYRGPLLEWLGR